MKRLKRPLPSRLVIGVLGLLITAGLMFSNNIDADVGVAIIIGILIAFGAYHMDPPERGNK